MLRDLQPTYQPLVLSCLTLYKLYHERTSIMQVPFVFISIICIVCKSRCNRDVQKGKTVIHCHWNVGKLKAQFTKVSGLFCATKKLWMGLRQEKKARTLQEMYDFSYSTCRRHRQQNMHLNICNKLGGKH